MRGSLGNATGKVDFPKVFHGFHKFNSYCPFAFPHGTYMDDPAFSLFASPLINNQYPLAVLYPCGQRKRSSMSAHGEHPGELVEGVQEYVLPKNMHIDGQCEPLASSEMPDWLRMRIHVKSKLESRPVCANGTGDPRT